MLKSESLAYLDAAFAEFNKTYNWTRFIAERVESVEGDIVIAGRAEELSKNGQMGPVDTVVLWCFEDGKTAGILQFDSIEAARAQAGIRRRIAV